MKKTVKSESKLTANQQQELIHILQNRFEKNLHRHKGVKWADVLKRIAGKTSILKPLHLMEETGGEPDVIGYDKKSDEFIYADCAAESPKGRRSVCYDGAALRSRKENKPADSAEEMAAAMGIEMLTEEEYRDLQNLEKFDTKTSSWLKTPAAIRKLGGAIFGDYRYGQVFVYHNGAESYYAARGFRGTLRV
jgi:hypothetical protein